MNPIPVALMTILRSGTSTVDRPNVRQKADPNRPDPTPAGGYRCNRTSLSTKPDGTF